ncbi:MAG: TIGR03915 family putative DNA repair protein [Pseudomonadota bacterium]|nr:TIGR03915 family putative DNA repair protein [Pseudomonadota bacterium]
MHFAKWRDGARSLLDRRIPPEQVHWDASQASLFATQRGQDAKGEPLPHIPRRLLSILEDVFCHRSERRLAIMYRAVWRTVQGEHDLIDDPVDDDASALRRMQHDVQRDSHKMTAFVRFRELVQDDGSSRWIAWYEPEHRIVERTASFFVRRFAGMHWTIATPDGIAVWDRNVLRMLPPNAELPLPADDAAEPLWLAYYRSIFNPARLNVRAMQREMPQKYWLNLPEAKLIPELVRDANQRAGCMVEAVRVENTRLRRRDVISRAVDTQACGTPELANCRRCPLWERATQAVPGEGRVQAALMLVGEHPETRRTSRDSRSSGLQGSCCVARSPKPASRRMMCTSPTR